MQSRHALSSAFGNKTSKKALQAEQINALTAATLGDTAQTAVSRVISSAVQEATASLPSRESMLTGQGNSKYLPPLHADEEGVTAETVYRLDEMLSQNDLTSCKVYQWEQAVNSGGLPSSSCVQSAISS
jgi:hypothetical protein